jgi:hypothetical protein
VLVKGRQVPHDKAIPDSESDLMESIGK